MHLVTLLLHSCGDGFIDDDGRCLEDFLTDNIQERDLSFICLTAMSAMASFLDTWSSM
jgi:hypothetical protein